MKLRIAFWWLLTAIASGAVAYGDIAPTLAQTAAHDGDVPADARPTARPADPEPRETGNPLWRIALDRLSATREHPLFSPSRRPPAPPASPAPAFVAPVAFRPPPPKEPEKPTLSLLGTIAGTTESFGIFLDAATRDVVRLRVGEDRNGWILKAVMGREATLEKAAETAVLQLPAPGASPPTPIQPAIGPGAGVPPVRRETRR
jgi:general secretion pathway protein N